MPWQLFGNGRTDWSAKLIRGLSAEAAAGFQSRRGRWREPTPVNQHYAAFATYKVARVRLVSWQRSGGMAAPGARAAASEAAHHRIYGLGQGSGSERRMKEKAAHACHALCRARVVEEIRLRKERRQQST